MAAALAQKLISMFCMLFGGFLIVKMKLLSPEDSRIISKVTLYLESPCVWISAFQIELSQENLYRFLLALINALIIHGLFILLTESLKRPLRLLPVERASMIYTNAVNLLIPVITTLLGEE